MVIRAKALPYFKLDTVNQMPLHQDAVADTTAPAASEGITIDIPDLVTLDLLSTAGVVVLRIGVILAFAYFAGRVIDRLIRRWARRYEKLPALDPTRQRGLTVSNLVGSTARYIVWPLAGIMVLSELRVDVAALIATAGVAGLAIGFGAQTLVKDVISGVFLLFDNTIAIGDRVRIGNEYGLVEYIGVRLIKVRKWDGELLMVPAGELRVFGNTSIGHMRAIIEVGVAYRSDIDKVIEILTRLAREWMESNRQVLVSEEPDVLALMGFADSALLARVCIAVVPGEQFRAERELRIAIKKAFDQAGIEIPFPQRTVHLAPGSEDLLRP